jgi:hypothetical protein
MIHHVWQLLLGLLLLLSATPSIADLTKYVSKGSRIDEIFAANIASTGVKRDFLVHALTAPDYYGQQSMTKGRKCAL